MRRLVLSLALGLAAAVLVAPSWAVAPQRSTISQNQVVQGTTSCGVLRWEIHLSGERFRFFDQEGRLVRVQIHIREDNTITNLTTGQSFREGPDSFMQTTLFTDEGPRIVATGLAARVQGAGVRDVGRVVINPATGEIEFSAGPHPLRESQEAGNVLEGFCPAFS
jgi:hypothetical protein